MPRQSSILSATASGPALIIEGLKLLWHPQIRWLVLIPLLINLLLFATATGFAAQWLGDWLENMLSSVPDWLHWLAWVIWLMFTSLALMIYAFTFTIVANLIGSPFYGLIAEKVILMTLDSHSQTAQSSPSLMSIAWSSFVRQLQLMAYLVPRTLVIGLLCFLISFIPLLNFAAPVIMGSWAGWSLSLQYLDYPADAQQVSFAQLRGRAGDQRLQTMGFGLSALAASAIPLLNLFLLPATVIGGTLLWCRRYSLEPSS
ncbi:MAG: CysZ protein [Porticoccaceae bacterium]|jgi:CysZ protein